jgi:hypothetical protein
MYGQKEGEDAAPAIPVELYRMHREVIEMIVVEMRKYSVGQLVLDLRPYGAMPLATLSWKPLDDDHAPERIQHVRPKILRAVQIYMEVFGIHTLGIELAAEELAELHTYWNFVQNGEEDKAAAQLQNVPLRFERDPTDTAVTQAPRKRTSTKRPPKKRAASKKAVKKATRGK